MERFVTISSVGRMEVDVGSELECGLFGCGGSSDQQVFLVLSADCQKMSRMYWDHENRAVDERRCYRRRCCVLEYSQSSAACSLQLPIASLTELVHVHLAQFRTSGRLSIALTTPLSAPRSCIFTNLTRRVALTGQDIRRAAQAQLHRATG